MFSGKHRGRSVSDERAQMIAVLRDALDHERNARARLATYVGRSMKQEAFDRYCVRSGENESELIVALAALGVYNA